MLPLKAIHSRRLIKLLTSLIVCLAQISAEYSSGSQPTGQPTQAWFPFTSTGQINRPQYVSTSFLGGWTFGHQPPPNQQRPSTIYIPPKPSFPWKSFQPYRRFSNHRSTIEQTVRPMHPTTGHQNLSDSTLRRAVMSIQSPVLLGGDILVKTNPGSNEYPQQQHQKVLTKRLIKFEHSALMSPVNLWPNGIIYYELDLSVTHLAELIERVMQQFHDETCIRFVPRENNEPDYIRIDALHGCFSYIGRIGGEQLLSLGGGCEYRGTIAHELLHAVGFFHHQNRSDRDDYLEIIWENIAKGKESQFLKMAPQENILLNQFDYDSIMLYGPHTFGKTFERVTMKPKRGGVILLEVVEKPGLSLLDIDSVNKLYKCAPLSY